MVESTWEHREMPILRAIAARTRDSLNGPSSDDVEHETGLTRVEVALALRDLERANYIIGPSVRYPDRPFWVELHLTERGLRVTERWPSESF